MTNVIPFKPVREESAAEIASRFGISVHDLRQQLRKWCTWHAHYDRWRWPVGSKQHDDMVVVARHVLWLNERKFRRWLGTENWDKLVAMAREG